MVKVYVGKDEKIFFIHRRLLSEASAFMRAELHQAAKASITDEIRLPDQEPDLFNRFTEWLYSGTVDISRMNGEASHDHLVWMIFSKLYLLAKYLQCPAFGNRVLNAAPYPPCHSSLPPSNVVKMVYDGTSNHCGIRKYLVATYVWMAKESCFKDEKSLECFATLPAEFVLDIAKFYIRGKANCDPFGVVTLGLAVFHDK